jgi:hypothetical protein
VASVTGTLVTAITAGSYNWTGSLTANYSSHGTGEVIAGHHAFKVIEVIEVIGNRLLDRFLLLSKSVREQDQP